MYIPVPPGGEWVFIQTHLWQPTGSLVLVGPPAGRPQPDVSRPPGKRPVHGSSELKPTTLSAQNQSNVLLHKRKTNLTTNQSNLIVPTITHPQRLQQSNRKHFYDMNYTLSIHKTNRPNLSAIWESDELITHQRTSP